MGWVFRAGRLRGDKCSTKPVGVYRDNKDLCNDRRIMPSLISHRDFQAARNLEFCYMCGKTFDGIESVDVDHVPPKTIFAKKDRNNPLVLKTHKTCNENSSVLDQIAGDFISVLHDTGRKRQKIEKHVEVLSEEKKLMVLRGVPLKQMVGRYIRAFHAALYREYLPYETKNTIQLPFPSGVPLNDGIRAKEVLPYFSIFSKILKKNRIAGNVDVIRSYSNHCRYFCVWSKLDNGQPCCLFALQIYNWGRLADTTHFPQRVCLGMYWNGGAPTNAATETILEIPMANLHPHDPFED